MIRASSPNESEMFRNRDAFLSFYEHTAFLGNGTIGLMFLLEAAGIRDKSVAVPVNVCPSVVQAVLYSGNRPHYLDIEADYMGLSPECLESEIKSVGAVIAVHSYGIPCEIESIAALCQENNTFLIEDCAQALGACINDKPVGTFGNAAVFSFGKGKIIDLGHGGMVTSRNADLIRRVETLSSGLPEWQPACDTMISDFNNLHTYFYNRFYPGREHLYSGLLYKAAMLVKDAYRFRMEKNFMKRLDLAFNRLSDNLSSRKKRARRLRDIFARESISFHYDENRSVFWRFILFLENGRDRILKILLNEQYKISSWYPRVDKFFHQDIYPGDFPNGESIGGKILNVWVNDEVDEDYIDRISRRILELCR